MIFGFPILELVRFDARTSCIKLLTQKWFWPSSVKSNFSKNKWSEETVIREMSSNSIRQNLGGDSGGGFLGGDLGGG